MEMQMARLIATYEVTDPLTFAGAFDEFQSVRTEHGALAHRLFRGESDRTTFVVNIDFPSLAAAEAFTADPRRARALRDGTVTSSHDLLVEEVDHGAAADGAPR